MVAAGIDHCPVHGQICWAFSQLVTPGWLEPTSFEHALGHCMGNMLKTTSNGTCDRVVLQRSGLRKKSNAHIDLFTCAQCETEPHWMVYLNSCWHWLHTKASTYITCVFWQSGTEAVSIASIGNYSHMKHSLYEWRHGFCTYVYAQHVIAHIH